MKPDIVYTIIQDREDDVMIYGFFYSKEEAEEYCEILNNNKNISRENFFEVRPLNEFSINGNTFQNFRCIGTASFYNNVWSFKFLSVELIDSYYESLINDFDIDYYVYGNDYRFHFKINQADINNVEQIAIDFLNREAPKAKAEFERQEKEMEEKKRSKPATDDEIRELLGL